MAKAIVATALMLAVPASPQDPSPGIDRELARQRAASVRDVEAWLRFRLTEQPDHVDGTIELRFVLPEEQRPDRPLVLDFAGESLTDVFVNAKQASVRQIEDHLVLPPDTLVAGLNSFRATFRSRVAPTGTPLTVYHDAVDGRDYCYTLLVPADAHRLFPCFDQPDLRTRFHLELDLPDGWSAVGNGAPTDAGESELGDVLGRLWRFAPTPPLPTYLFAFACGPFAEIEARQPDVPGITATAPMRFLLRASRLDDFDRETLVRLHHDGLRWLAGAFGVPYPFDKLDVVLLPGFPYGGMEHAGAIFYRETALLFDHPPTDAEQVRRSTLVYHELSHQWFGNLVTMRWFDDLWLKEGFATFYGYRALAALEPDRGAWLRFLQRVKPRAYEVDATPGTTPVFQELQNLADAKSAYGAIVYNKAPAVLRALFEELGEDTFEAGVRAFLTAHAFGNADWQDLASALENAARRDLDRWSSRWLLAPSMPQVRIEWRLGDDGLVEEAAVTQRAIGGEGSWPLDLELLVFGPEGDRQTLRVSSDGERTPLPELIGKAPPAAVLANPRDIAYGQFLPNATTTNWLIDHLLEEPDPLVRAVATQALSEAVREAELDPAVFARLVLQRLAVERDPETHGALLADLGTCLGRYLAADRAAPLQAAVTALLLRQLRDEAGSGRELTTFRFLARRCADDAVLTLCEQVVADAELPRGLTPGREDAFLAAAALLAAGRGDAAITGLRERFRQQDIEKEAFLAGAAAPDDATKRSYWQRYLVADDPPEQWIQDSLAWFHWPGQDELTLPFLRPALDQVDWVKQHRRIFFMPAWLDAFVNGHSSPAALAIVDDFLATRELSPDIRRKLLQSRDGLWRAVRIRATFPR